MKRLSVLVLSLVGLAAPVRAEPPADADRAIEADLARAQSALARRDTSAVVETLDDAMKHLSDADAASLRALIAFEDRFRDALTEAAAEPTAPTRSPSGFSPEPAPTPAPPPSPPAPEPSASAAPPPSQPPAPEPKPEMRAVLPPLPAPPSRPLAKAGLAWPRAPVPGLGAWSQRAVQQPFRPAPGADPWRDERHREVAGTVGVPSPGLAPEPLVRTAPQPAAVQADGAGVAQRQPGPNRQAGGGSHLRLLGYYAQDEAGRWVWLPAGSEDAPPAPR
jgi:hypothetical protein